jgi:hypothetical protein
MCFRLPKKADNDTGIEKCSHHTRAARSYPEYKTPLGGLVPRGLNAPFSKHSSLTLRVRLTARSGIGAGLDQAATTAGQKSALRRPEQFQCTRTAAYQRLREFFDAVLTQQHYFNFTRDEALPTVLLINAGEKNGISLAKV